MALLAAAGCDGGDDGETRLARDAKLAGDTVTRLERAIAGRDFRVMCEDLFSRALRTRLGGRECPGRLRRSARGVRNPRIRVERISLQGKGDRARVHVVTNAASQAPARDVLELIRERGRYRVDGLGATGDR